MPTTDPQAINKLLDLDGFLLQSNKNYVVGTVAAG